MRLEWRIEYRVCLSDVEQFGPWRYHSLAFDRKEAFYSAELYSRQQFMERRYEYRVVKVEAVNAAEYTRVSVAYLQLPLWELPRARWGLR